MPSCIEVGDYFDEVMEALVEAGLYSSKAEVVRDALRRLLEELDMRRVGLRAYTRGSTFWRALRVAGVGFDEFLSYMVASGVAPELGCREPPPPPPPPYVLDPTGLELLGRLGVLDNLSGRLLLPAELEKVAAHVEASTGSVVGASFVRVSGYRGLARKLGITLEEAAVLKLAAEKGVLVYCDPRLAARAGHAGVPSISCCYSLLRLVDRRVWEPRMTLLPVVKPRL